MPPVGGGVRSGLWEAVEEDGNVSKGVMVRARKGAAEKGSAFGQNVLQRNARGSPRGGSSGCCLLSVPLGACIRPPRAQCGGVFVIAVLPSWF